MKKKRAIAGALTLVLIVFFMSPPAAYVRSLAVMKIYSGINQRSSLLAEKKIEIEMESGEGWYPFVMTYSADAGFRSFTGDKNLRLVILYNFPEFDMKKGCSRLYDDGSEYYNSFYGAYALNGSYGFDKDGRVELKKLSQVPEYDFTRLVLSDLGLSGEEMVFLWNIADVTEDVEFIGYDGWTLINAQMTVNGVLHKKGSYLRNYIQYGSPHYDVKENFAPVDMKGRVYARYFEEVDCSIFLYVMTGSESVLEGCDKNILAKSRIKL